MALNIVSFCSFYWDHAAFEQSSEGFHLAFLSISKEGSLWRTFLSFFNKSKASFTHKWNFHLILCVITDNRLCSVVTGENTLFVTVPILHGNSCPRHWSFPAFCTSRNTAEPQFAMGMETVSAFALHFHESGFVKEVLWEENVGSQVLFHLFHALSNIPDGI